MISLSRQAIMSSAHRCKNSVVSTMRNRGLRFSLSAAKSAIVFLACASVASLVAGSHLSSSVFHSSWCVITPYWVLATSVGIPLFPSSLGPGQVKPAVAKLSGPATIAQSFDPPDRVRLVGVNPEPGPGLHQRRQPGADKLRP